VPYLKKRRESMATLEKIEGIGPKYGRKLGQIGIKTTQALLKKGATPKGRKEIEESSGLGHKLILEWVNLADLFRIKGIGEEYSDLIEEAGVDTVVELAQRRADNLYEKILEVNAAKKLVRRPPSAGMVADWIKQAKKLPRVVKY
jgi:predicted flap endonuclease-1-like 5' DNA nuclease